MRKKILGFLIIVTIIGHTSLVYTLDNETLNIDDLALLDILDSSTEDSLLEDLEILLLDDIELPSDIDIDLINEILQENK